MQLSFGDAGLRQPHERVTFTVRGAFNGLYLRADNNPADIRLVRFLAARRLGYLAKGGIGFRQCGLLGRDRGFAFTGPDI